MLKVKPPKGLSGSKRVEFKTIWNFKWIFRATLTGDANYELVSPVLDFPEIPGEWHLFIEGNGEAVSAGVSFDQALPGSLHPIAPKFGQTTTMQLTLTAMWSVDDGGPEPVWSAYLRDSSQALPSVPTGTLYRDVVLDDIEDYDSEIELKYELRFEITQYDQSAAERAVRVEYARDMSQLLLLPVVHDLRLHFPRVNLSLWTNSATLSSKSPYISTLLSSGFSESVKKRGKRPRTKPTTSSTAASATDDRDRDEQDDSDTENDDLYLSRGTTDISLESELEYSEIKIISSCYATMRSALVFLQTGYIQFAPLSSKVTTDDSQSSTSTPSRAQYLADFASSHPSLPLPVSPKSMYRLAHLLELPTLQKLALDNFRSQVDSMNVIEELFDPVCTFTPSYMRRWSTRLRRIDVR